MFAAPNKRLIAAQHKHEVIYRYFSADCHEYPATMRKAPTFSL